MIVCAAARDLIDAFVTESLSASDAESLAGHVRGCPACAARLGSVTRLTELLASLPAVEPSPGFEERQLAAAITDRLRRHEHRSWLAELRIQVVRGALRTTGTLAATIAAVALLGAAFVFAASNLFPGIAQQVLQGHSSPRPTAPITAIGPATAQPTPAPTPQVVIVTPSPTPPPVATPPATRQPVQTPTPTVAPSPSATPESTPVIVVAPTAEPSASPTASPTPEPSASASTKPRRCPPGTACYSPSPSPVATPPTSP